MIYWTPELFAATVGLVALVLVLHLRMDDSQEGGQNE